jgi:hypothetical protein
MQALADSSPGNAFGIDSGANINLGFQFALSDGLSVGVSRTRFRKIVSLLSTYEIRTDKENLWKSSLVGELEGWDNFTDHYAFSLQWANSLDLGGFRFYSNPILVINSKREVGAATFSNSTDSNHTLSLGLGADLLLNRRFSLSAEFVPRLAGYGGSSAHYNTASGAFKIRSWGHVFTVGVSTSRTFNPSQFAVNAEKDVSLGFNIYRRIY